MVVRNIFEENLGREGYDVIDLAGAVGGKVPAVG
jgi:hypothetical protein